MTSQQVKCLSLVRSRGTTAQVWGVVCGLRGSCPCAAQEVVPSDFPIVSAGRDCSPHLQMRRLYEAAMPKSFVLGKHHTAARRCQKLSLQLLGNAHSGFRSPFTPFPWGVTENHHGQVPDVWWASLPDPRGARCLSRRSLWEVGSFLYRTKRSQ